MLAGFVINHPADAGVVNEAAIEHDPFELALPVPRQGMFAQVLAIARAQYPSSSRIAMHAQQRFDDTCGRLIQSILGHAVQLEPSTEMALVRTDRRLIKAGEFHPLQLGMHQAADASCGFAGPVEYRRLVPRESDGRRPARQGREMTVLRPFQWQALERPAARCIVGSLRLAQRWRRQLEFAGEHWPQCAQQASGVRAENPAWRSFIEVFVIFSVDDSGQTQLAL